MAKRILWGLLFLALSLPAGADSGPTTNEFWLTLQKATTANFNTFFLFQREQPSMTDMNPDNLIYRIPRYTTVLELRPDVSFHLNEPDILLSASPRAHFDELYYEDGAPRGETDGDSELQLRRYMLRTHIRSANLMLSAFRQNYQWGPAYIGTPSNPFFTLNTQQYPFQEMPGMDFLSALWAPDDRLAYTYLYNYDDGAEAPGDPASMGEFHRTHAGKADFYFTQWCFSLIGADRQDEHNMLGSYGQWTVADAWLLYYDAAVREGTSAYYPVSNPELPTGGTLERVYDDDTTLLPEGVLGTSYTTMQNITFYVEYLYYGPGYTAEQHDRLSDISSRSASVLETSSDPQARGLAMENLGNAYFNGLRWQRRHECMFQITKDIGPFSLVLHTVVAPEEWSGYIYGSVILAQNNHHFMFAINQNFGAPDGEYRQQIDYLYSLGYMLKL